MNGRVLSEHDVDFIICHLALSPNKNDDHYNCIRILNGNAMATEEDVKRLQSKIVGIMKDRE